MEEVIFAELRTDRRFCGGFVDERIDPIGSRNRLRLNGRTVQAPQRGVEIRIEGRIADDEGRARADGRVGGRLE